MCGPSLRGLDDLCRASYGEGRKGEAKEGPPKAWAEESLMEVCSTHLPWTLGWVGSCEPPVSSGNFKEDLLLATCRVCLYGTSELIPGDPRCLAFLHPAVLGPGSCLRHRGTKSSSFAVLCVWIGRLDGPCWGLHWFPN